MIISRLHVQDKFALVSAAKKDGSDGGETVANNVALRQPVVFFRLRLPHQWDPKNRTCVPRAISRGKQGGHAFSWSREDGMFVLGVWFVGQPIGLQTLDVTRRCANEGTGSQWEVSLCQRLSAKTETLLEGVTSAHP